MAKTRKKNPQDTTLRNVNALKKRVVVLEARTLTLVAQMDVLGSVVTRLDQRSPIETLPA